MSRDTVIIQSSNSIDKGHEYLVMQQTFINLKKENVIGKYGYISNLCFKKMSSSD